MGLPRRQRRENRCIPCKFNVARLTNNGRLGGWGTFKKRLMRQLNITDSFDKWDVPQPWIVAYQQYFRNEREV